MGILGSLKRIRREVRTTGREVSKRFGVGEGRQLREMVYYYRRSGRRAKSITASSCIGPIEAARKSSST